VTTHNERYDVAILGSGIGGSILAAILARQGLEVLLLEQGEHPRFAIGESTIPETTRLFRLLAARYDVPEIAYLASYQLLSRHVGSSHGVKRNFSFVYHHLDRDPDPKESTQYPTAAPPIGPDVHLFRQDADAYMFNVAVAYGARALQRTDVDEFVFEEDAVLLRSKDGREFRTSYFVDAGGLKSLTARQFGLRQTPCPLKTRSRSIYTHMVGVAPYDACRGGRREHGLPSPLSQGTLHHLFPGGWMWVIPFNNHPASTNPVVSVGLNLNIDRFPKSDIPAEQEFWSIIDRLPGIGEQMRGARPVRPWIGTDRLQFSSTTAAGHRFCMLPHAFSFVDPLFSSGLGVTMNAINSLAARIIRAARSGDFSEASFQYVDTWTKRNYQYYDRLVSGSYTAFDDFALWNAWTRLWMLGGILGAMGAFELLTRCQRGEAPDELYESYPYRAVQGSELRPFAALFDACEAQLGDYVKRVRSADEVAGRIMDLERESRLWPAPWGMLRPEKRHTGTFRMSPLLRTGLWMRHRSPAEVRRHYFVKPKARATVWHAMRDLGAEISRSALSAARLVRDYLFDWNSDWRQDAAYLRLPALARLEPRRAGERPVEADQASAPGLARETTAPPAGNGSAIRVEGEVVRPSTSPPPSGASRGGRVEARREP
jgi:FADH2 O2-dependent halogenase